MNIIKKIKEFLEKEDAECDPKNTRMFNSLIIIAFGMMVGHWLTILLLIVKWVWEGKAYGDCLGFWVELNFGENMSLVCCLL